jgi:hypothetical protein
MSKTRLFDSENIKFEISNKNDIAKFSAEISPIRRNNAMEEYINNNYINNCKNESIRSVYLTIADLTEDDYKKYPRYFQDKNLNDIHYSHCKITLSFSIKNGSSFNKSDSEFRNAVVLLEKNGLSLREGDKIIKGYERFLKDHNIQSEFIAKAGQASYDAPSFSRSAY